jgi:O-antigen ligase/polysaccharide polymerase Wzy-like membrane protein
MQMPTGSLTANYALTPSKLGVHAKAGTAAPLLVKLVAISTFLPEELSFYLSGLRLTLTRLILIIITPLLIVRFSQKVIAGRYRLVVSDILVIFAGFWMIYALANVIGLPDSLNHAGPSALEFCIGYMTTRFSLREHGQALSFANLVCCVIAVSALLALADPFAGHYFTHDVASLLTGYRRAITMGLDDMYRMGLFRAEGPLEHPILFGLTCAVGLLIAVGTPIRARRLTIIACGLGLLIAVSSAPIQGAIMGLVLLAYGRVSANVPGRWLLLVFIAALGGLGVYFASNSPFGIIFRHLMLDPESGYYRFYTWQMVTSALAQSPWFGLGWGPFETEFDITPSVDSLWLMSALTFGIPGAALVGLSMIGAASRKTSGPTARLTMEESKLGTALGVVIFILIFLAFTVHYWGTTWVLAGLLTGVRAHLGELAALR